MSVWLIGITTEGHEEDLRQLIEPIKNDFDGLIWTFHYPLDSGYDYLCSVKGDGEIIKTKWCNRLDFSRNHCLFQGPMKSGDWFLTIDTLERLSPDFTNNLKNLCLLLDKEEVDGCYLYNKRFLFKLNEKTHFRLNPHEGIAGSNKSIELSKQPFWKESYQKNVRGERRQNPFHFIDHNFKYYLFPDTNHLILGFEDDPSLVDKRYKNRKKFLKEVDSLGFNSLDVTSVKECLGGPLTETLKECINFDKFLNDWYRYHILEQKEGLVDKHDFSVFSPIFK
jgi:hypothetical protein|tara:strand:+ start:2416 stop:3255 length:840 start_codon:yes stop_codon:yes gene_type:complete